MKLILGKMKNLDHLTLTLFSQTAIPAIICKLKLAGKTRCLIGKTSCLIGKTSCLIGKTSCLIGKTSCLIGKTSCLVGKTRR
jgi:hypothetical protein